MSDDIVEVPFGDDAAETATLLLSAAEESKDYDQHVVVVSGSTFHVPESVAKKAGVKSQKVTPIVPDTPDAPPENPEGTRAEDVGDEKRLGKNVDYGEDVSTGNEDDKSAKKSTAKKSTARKRTARKSTAKKTAAKKAEAQKDAAEQSEPENKAAGDPAATKE